MNTNISLDLGFDSLKIVSDPDTFINTPLTGFAKIPFNVVPINSNTIQVLRYKESYIQFISENGNSFLVGEYARDRIYSERTNIAIKEEMADFYSQKRFTNELCKIAILTAIGYTIAAKYPGMANGKDSLKEDVNLELALPTSLAESLTPYMISSLKGKHTFSLIIGSDARRFNFICEIKYVGVIAQAVAALIAATSDDDGCLDDKLFDNMMAGGDTLLLDGGYGTQGLIPISSSGAINPSNCTSIFDYTMKCINERTSQIIYDEYGKDFPHYTIETIILQKAGKAKGVNVSEIREKALKETAKAFSKYLRSTYNNLDDFERIALVGGTNACLRKYLQEALLDSFSEEDVYLLECVLRGEKVFCEYIIAAGAYKTLKGILNS